MNDTVKDIDLPASISKNKTSGKRLIISKFRKFCKKFDPIVKKIFTTYTAE